MERGDFVDLNSTRAMASSKYQTVVEGEASETDSDEEVCTTSVAAEPSACMVVTGEASETDEDEGEEAEEEVQAVRNNGLIQHEDLTSLTGQGAISSLTVERRPGRVEICGETEVPAQISRPPGTRSYNTLLQLKLRESNARLRGDVAEMVRKAYTTAARDVRNTTQRLGDSQVVIIEASNSLHHALDNLHSIRDKMDIITSCNLLPEIHLPAEYKPS